MAKIADTSGASNIWLGSKQNARQTILYVPAQQAANKPGLIFLESIDDSAAASDLGGIYLWADDDDELHASGTYPTNQDDATTILGGTGDVTAAAAFAVDNTLIRSDSTGKGVQKTTIVVADTTYDLTLPDGADLKLQEEITFTGATTENKIVLTDNLAVALDITESTNSYIQFVTTNGSEAITIGKVFNATTASTIGNLTLGDGSIVDSGGTIDFTTTNLTTGGDIKIDVDDGEMQFGVDGATDSYIRFDGTSLLFYDSEVAAAVSLDTLLTGTQLNPTVWGDLGVAEGKFDWTNAVDEVAGTWSFAHAGSGSDVDIASVVDTGESIHIIANSITTGKALLIETDSIGAAGALIHLDITQASHDNAGFFFECYDGAANQFQIGEYGATTIKGVGGGTAVLTFTKGDLVMSDGVINADVDSAHGHNIATAQAGSATYPLVTVTSSDAAHDQPLLKLDSASTTDINTLEIVNDGQGYGISIDDQKTDGNGLEVLMVTGSTKNGIFIDANTGSFVGSSGAGMLHIHQSGTLLHAATSAIFVNFDGVPASSGLGYCLNIDDDSSVISGTYAVSVNTLANNAMKLETQSATMTALTLLSKVNTSVPVLFVDGDTNNWLGADDKGMITIDNDIAMNAGASLLVLDYNGTGTSNAEGTCFRALDTGSAAANTPYAAEIASTANNGLQISTGATGKTALTLKSAAATTTAVLKIDGDTNGWTGTNNVGMLHIDNDTALAQTTASMLLLDYATVKPKDSALGYCLRVADAAPVASNPPAYAVYIDSTANEGLGIQTQATAAKNLVLVGVASQADNMLHVDGTTGTGWVGAANVGMVQINSKVAGAQVTSTNLLVTHATGTPKSDADGFLARFVTTATAQTNAYAVDIVVPATQPALRTNGIVNIAGQDSPGAYLVQITANDDTGNKGALDIHASGTDPALRVTGDEDDTEMASFISAANQDSDGVLIDGDTAGYLGADGVGQLHIQNDIAGGHANATMLLIDKDASGIAEINSAEGSCLRIVENMDVAASPPAYAMYISCVDNEALHVDSGLCQFDEGITSGVDGTTVGHADFVHGASTNTPSYIMLDSVDGTPTYLFAANNGTLRYHSAVPTADGDGTQVNA